MNSTCRDRAPALRILLAMIALLSAAACASGTVAADRPADRLEIALTSTPGDAARGRQIVISREGGHCILCHHVPDREIKVFGNVGPALDGIGSRLDAAQLRRRVVDIGVLNPQALMPAFHRASSLARVAAQYRGQPVLSAQQVEDVLAYLGSLKQ